MTDEPDLLTYLGDLFYSSNMFSLFESEKNRLDNLTQSVEDRERHLLFCRRVLVETAQHYFANEVSSGATLEAMYGTKEEKVPVHEWLKQALERKHDFGREALPEQTRKQCREIACLSVKLPPPMQMIERELEMLDVRAKNAENELRGIKVRSRFWILNVIREAYLIENIPQESDLWRTFAPVRCDAYIDSDWTIHFVQKVHQAESP
jgi:hypothetical protein